MLLSVLLRERCCRRPAHIQCAHWYFFVNNFNWQLLEPTNTSVGSMGIEDQLYVLQKGAERHAGPGQTHLCGVASLSCKHCHSGQDATLALCSAWFWYPFSNSLCPVCTQPVFHLYPAKIQKSPRS